MVNRVVLEAGTPTISPRMHFSAGAGVGVELPQLHQTNSHGTVP